MKLSLTLPSLALLSLGICQGLATTIFDDFDDGNDTTPPWTFIDVSQGAGSRNFYTDNKHYQLIGPASASIRQDFTIRDGEVRCEINSWNPSVGTGSSVGILARFDPTTLSGYFLSIDADGSPNLNLVKLVNGQPLNGAGLTGPTKTYTQGTYIFQMILQGAKLTCRIYSKGTPNTLIDEFVWTDPSPFNSGVTGLLVANDKFGSNFDPTFAVFDNFYATDGLVSQPIIVRPTLTTTDFQFAFGTVPGRSYIVESKKDLLQANWDQVTTYGPLSVDTTRTVIDPLESGNKFFRVRVADNSL